MNVNATIIVQVINFFVLYVIVRWTLIKPAAQVILHDAQVHDGKVQNIEQCQQELALYHKERDHVWKRYRSFCAERVPSIIEMASLVVPIEVKAVEPITFDKEVIATIVNQTTDALTKTIRRHDGL